MKEGKIKKSFEWRWTKTVKQMNSKMIAFVNDSI